jgi:ribosome-associated protein
MANKMLQRERDVVIRAEYVELCDLLKFEGLASSGGEAKVFIAEGRVRVNGEVDTRKRKKMRVGDVVTYAGQTLRLVGGPAAPAV